MDEERCQGDYEYDVFFSYSRKHLQWFERFFLEPFEEHLGAALGYSFTSFYDQQIKTGTEWAKRLQSALARSRVLVPLWSIPYFESEWCRTELAVMLYRQQKVRKEIGDDAGLVLPIRYSDGDRYPEIAKQIQGINLTLYNTVTDRGHDKYREFQEEIKKRVDPMADIIRKPPKWNCVWENNDWLKAAVEAFDNQLQPPCKPPSLPGMS
jgi:hypothetical protein